MLSSWPGIGMVHVAPSLPGLATKSLSVVFSTKLVFPQSLKCMTSGNEMKTYEDTLRATCSLRNFHDGSCMVRHAGAYQLITTRSDLNPGRVRCPSSRFGPMGSWPSHWHHANKPAANAPRRVGLQIRAPNLPCLRGVLQMGGVLGGRLKLWLPLWFPFKTLQKGVGSRKDMSNCAKPRPSRNQCCPFNSLHGPLDNFNTRL